MNSSAASWWVFRPFYSRNNGWSCYSSNIWAHNWQIIYNETSIKVQWIEWSLYKQITSLWQPGYFVPEGSIVLIYCSFCLSSLNVCHHFSPFLCDYSDQQDPFNRAPLTPDMLKPDGDLKDKIMKWKQKQLAKNWFADSCVQMANSHF